MSRLGKKPIELPSGVEIKVEGDKVHVKGPKGQLTVDVVMGFLVKIEEKSVSIEQDPKVKTENSFYGLFRTLIFNAVEGVTKGFQKKLTLIGVGYRASMQGDKINMQLGFSHPTLLSVPKGLDVKIDQGTSLIVSGIDKQQVGQFAAQLRALRPPEPYKGKGVRYENEYVRKKAGKAAKGA